MRDKVLFWSLATEERRYSISASLLYRFDQLFERTDLTWYLANAKFDMHMLTNMGVTLRSPKSDIIVMDAMDDDTRPHGLKEQGWLTYEANWGDFKELFLDPEFVAKNLGLDRKSFTAFKELSVGDKLLFVYDERPDIVHDYASCDAYFTYLLGEDLRERLSNLELPTQLIPEMSYMYDLFLALEQPLTDELWEMERNGILIDTDYVKKIDGPMRDGLTGLSKKLAKHVGRDFNIDSADQIRDYLFEDPKGLQLKPVKYTSGGKSGVVKKSVDAKTLKILKDRVPLESDAHKFLSLLEEYRTLKTLHGTYVEKVHSFIGPDGRFHCRINQAGARTGRMSTANPSLQNIPIRNDVYKIRGMFVAEDGYMLLDADYPQIEFRVVAVLAEEEEMLEAMRRGWDIHSANAPLMFSDVTYEDIMGAVEKKEAKASLTDYEKYCLKRRGHAKETGLASLYGQGPRSVAEKLGCSVEEAKDLIFTFFDRFKNIDELRHNTWDFAYANEMTYTMLGRIRRLWSINGGNRGLEAADKRKALNTAVQGSAAEMMKLAIIRVGQSKELKQLGFKQLLTVHDEIIGEVPTAHAKEANEIMCNLMGDPYRVGPIQLTYPVSIQPDGVIIKRWSEAK
jgi:DNA polymerase I-like protein with 3'-5' exonuclease and polymerase domains